MVYVFIWLWSRNRGHDVRGAARTYSFMLGATRGTDQIGIAKVLSSPAMIACGVLFQPQQIVRRRLRHPICCFSLDKGVITSSVQPSASPKLRLTEGQRSVSYTPIT